VRIPKSVANTIEAFEQLPGIGPKSAARLTYYLLHAPDNLSEKLSEAVSELKKRTRICSTCQNITEMDPCEICEDQNRDQGIICVVEDPLDVWAIEKSGSFGGLYHVLHGVIAPLDNIGPEELKIRELLERLKSENVTELILATNPSMEGEATAMYIVKKLKTHNPKLKTTRLGMGIPTGADLEYADETTLTQALEGRREL
jgi:recombination protein RecR